MAAVIGERFDVEPLAAAVEQDALEVVRQLEILRVSQGLLEEDGDGYRFAHSRYREALLAAGQFRRDFFYRLAGVEIHLPPLRERRDDIPHLIAHILRQWANRRGRNCPTITTRAVQQFLASDWPGNVRELIHVVERAAEEARGEPITPSHLTLHASQLAHPVPPPDQDEHQRLLATLRAADGNVSEAARRLGIHRNTLHRRLRKLGIK